MDRRAARQAIADFLKALGYDSAGDPELAQTPARVADAFIDELLAGQHVDIPALLDAGLSSASRMSGLVAVHNLSVSSICPHHLLPATGVATVVYKPGKQVLGLGALASLVDACSRRLTLQEEIGEQVVDALVQHAGASGAYCEITLSHGCVVARGSKQAQARIRTSARAGDLDLQELALAIKT